MISFFSQNGGFVQGGLFALFMLIGLPLPASERSERLAAEREAEANELGANPDFPLLTRSEGEIVGFGTMSDASPNTLKTLRETPGLTEKLLDSLWDNLENQRSNGTRLLFKALAERPDLKAADVKRLGDEVEKMIRMPKENRPYSWRITAPEGLMLLAKNQEPRTEKLCVYLLENSDGVPFIQTILQAMELVGGEESLQAIRNYMERNRGKGTDSGRLIGQKIYEKSLNEVSKRITGQGENPRKTGNSAPLPTVSGTSSQVAGSGRSWVGLFAAFLGSAVVGWLVFPPKSGKKA